MTPVATRFLPPNLQKEQFSRAYVLAVASSAGFEVAHRDIDVDSVDCTIHSRDKGGEVEFPSLDIQLKCTSTDRTNPHFDLKRKNYDDLRAKRQAPAILVVLFAPVEVADWVTFAPDQLIARYSAYWMSLRGEAQKEQESIRVKLPSGQAFDAVQLSQIMSRLAKGQMP